MKICPIAITVGCAKCPVFSVCPVKSLIGDQPARDGKAVSGAAVPASHAKSPRAAKSSRPSQGSKGTKPARPATPRKKSR